MNESAKHIGLIRNHNKHWKSLLDIMMDGDQKRERPFYLRVFGYWETVDILIPIKGK